MLIMNLNLLPCPHNLLSKTAHIYPGTYHVKYPKPATPSMTMVTQPRLQASATRTLLAAQKQAAHDLPGGHLSLEQIDEGIRKTEVEIQRLERF
jgi:hypothetical protein